MAAPAIVNDETSSQPKSGPATLPQESPAKTTPRLEAAKSRVANLLHVFAPKAPKKTDTPERPPAIQEEPVRPVIGSDRAALFLDSKGGIVAAQPRCASFFGRQPDEISGLNIKDLLKPGFDQEILDVLTKGQQASDMSFHVLGLRKDGSEFPTQLSFKFLLEDFGFRWTVFVQAPPGMEFPAAGELQQIVPTTETTTQTETPNSQSEEKPPTRPVRSRSRNPEKLAAQLEAAQSECKRLERVKFEAEKRLRQAQTDYGNRVIQLEEDLSAERQVNEQISKRLEAQEQSFTAQFKGMQKFKQQHPESATPDNNNNNSNKAELEGLQQRHQALETELAAIQKERDELRSKLKASPATEPQTNSNTAELTAKFESASSELQSLRKGAEESEAARKQLKAELDKERDANKLSQKKAEELQAQFQKLQGAAEQAEARVRESTTRCSDWEKKVADLNKTTDELSQSHAAGKSASAQSAQRIKELEQQLKDANANLTTSKAELEKDREAIKLSRKKEEELNAQVQKLQKTTEQAEGRALESGTQSKDWEKKAADLKKSLDELTQSHSVEKNVGSRFALRVKELEQQLKRTGDDLAAGKTEIEKQNSTRQKLEAENRNLTETNTKAKAELEKERETIKLSQKKEEELNAQVQKLQKAAEQSEGRVRESAAQSKDWEKKAADLKKSLDELTQSHAVEKNVGARFGLRVKELEQQLKRTGDDLATGKSEIEKQTSTRQKLETEIRNLTEANTRTKADLDKEREATKLSRKREDELNAQVQKLQKAAQQAEGRILESTAQSRDWEKKAADLKKSLDEVTRSHFTEKNAGAQSAQRVKELEQKLNDAIASVAAGKAEIEKQNSARQKLETENRNVTQANSRTNADLDMERDAHKLFRQKAEELSAQVKNLHHATEQAEARVRENAAQSKDWEKKAAELKKTVDELTRSHASEKTTATQSTQRVNELGQQLKRVGDELAISKTEFEKQNSARQKLEAENRNLTEANTRTRADLDKEREANKLSRKKEEELTAQVQKLQQAAEHAEARAREGAAQSKNWETKAAELKKNADELTRSHAAEQTAAAQSTQRVKELEQQLKRASDELASGKSEFEKHQSAHKRFEVESRDLIESAAKAKAEFAESAKNQAALQKRAGELEQRLREGVSSLAKATAELQSERVERERAEKCASSATTHMQQLNEMLERQLELERSYRSKIAELEKAHHDRGDDLARASAALRKETKERQIAQKHSRLVSDMGNRLESNLASLDDAKKTFEASMQEKDDRLQIIERSLADTQSGLQKESTERRRIEGQLTEARRQLEKISGESKVEISRLQAALELRELQSKQLEVDLLRTRDVANSAEHGLGMTLENLRLELRQSMEELRQSACSLLESKVTDVQKRKIETVLEKALFVQVTLNAGAKPNSESDTPANGQRPDSRNKKGE